MQTPPSILARVDRFTHPDTFLLRQYIPSPAGTIEIDRSFDGHASGELRIHPGCTFGLEDFVSAAYSNSRALPLKDAKQYLTDSYFTCLEFALNNIDSSYLQASLAFVPDLSRRSLALGLKDALRSEPDFAEGEIYAYVHLAVLSRKDYRAVLYKVRNVFGSDEYRTINKLITYEEFRRAYVRKSLVIMASVDALGDLGPEGRSLGKIEECRTAALKQLEHSQDIFPIIDDMLYATGNTQPGNGTLESPLVFDAQFFRAEAEKWVTTLLKLQYMEEDPVNFKIRLALQLAISDENYELAAELRDQLK